MKFLLTFLLAVLPILPAFSQSTLPAATLEKRILTNADLLKYLLATTWSWQRPNGPKEKLQFFADGSVRHTAFVAKFTIKNPHEVELRIGKDKVKLTFDKNFERFNGIDFNGSRPVEGERQRE